MAALEERLRGALAGSPLAERLPVVAESFLQRRSGDAALAILDGARLTGLARVLATSLDAARWLAHRPALVERVATADAATLAARGDALAGEAAAAPDDLEQALDALRLLRRDETVLAACLDLGGAAPFDAVSVHLSRLAEAILAESLRRARRTLSDAAPSLSALGMGKIGGQEFTYHSDLDLIFLCQGGVEAVAQASRVAQRLISYLTTRTGAGVAYAVDSRLRPSGNQGLLVTTLDAFARYQREEAQTWEHLALMRARAVAGDVASAQRTLDAVRDDITGRGRAPWDEIAAMRRKVEEQRGQENATRLALKTGAGGLMDVDFLAAGARLERGGGVIPYPSNPALLHATVPGARTEAVLAAYASLRRIEARARWVTGRAVESLEPEGEAFGWIAALASPDGTAAGLRQAVDEARARVRSAFAEVAERGSVTTLLAG